VMSVGALALLLALATVSCGGAEASRKSTESTAIKSAPGDASIAKSIDASEADSAPIRDPSMKFSDDAASDQAAAEEEQERRSEHEQKAAQELRRASEERRLRELQKDAGGEAGGTGPLPSEPAPRDMAPTVQATEAAQPTGREREDSEFEGDTWEAESPRERVEDLVTDLRELLDDAHQEGYRQRVPGGGALSCADVCKLSEAICASSGKICTIATAHPTESWFQGQCQWSRNECRTAGQECRVCTH